MSEDLGFDPARQRDAHDPLPGTAASPSRPAARPGSLSAPPAQRTSAAAARPPGTVGVLTDRLLIASGTRELDNVLASVNRDWSGLWIGGADAAARVARYRQAGLHDLIMVADPEHYRSHYATPEEPFSLDHQDTLLPGTLNTALDEQLHRGATVAVTPSRYVRAGDFGSLKAMVDAASALGRTDTILVLPVAVAFVNREYSDQFIAVLATAGMPIAVMLGGQWDPLETVAVAAANLRRLQHEVPYVMRACTDLSALDGLCHGGFAGAIGLGTGRRHLVPPGERALSSGKPGAPLMPSVLVPELMRFMLASTLERKCANTSPPRCRCSICQGAWLTRLLDPREDRVEARNHNVAVWSTWMHDLLRLPTIAQRARWWKGHCELAVDNHQLYNRRVDDPKAFIPPEPVLAWATLPA